MIFLYIVGALFLANYLLFCLGQWQRRRSRKSDPFFISKDSPFYISKRDLRQLDKEKREGKS